MHKVLLEGFIFLTYIQTFERHSPCMSAPSFQSDRTPFTLLSEIPFSRRPSHLPFSTSQKPFVVELHPPWFYSSRTLCRVLRYHTSGMCCTASRPVIYVWKHRSRANGTLSSWNGIKILTLELSDFRETRGSRRPGTEMSMFQVSVLRFLKDSMVMKTIWSERMIPGKQVLSMPLPPTNAVSTEAFLLNLMINGWDLNNSIYSPI